VSSRRLLPDTFTELEFAGLPEPVCRYFAAAIAPGVPLDGAVQVDVRGRVRGRRVWTPFRAQYEITHQLDFMGFGSAAQLIVGCERYVAGAAERRARLARLVPLQGDGGDDLSRSAAGRAALAAVLLPTALLPRFGVAWQARDANDIRGALQVNDVPVVLRLCVDGDGRLLSAVVDRWGDPDGVGRWGWHPFGAVFTAETSYAGLTVPSAGRAGWYMGTDRWRDGEVLRFRVTAVRRVHEAEWVAGGIALPAKFLRVFRPGISPSWPSPCRKMTGA
jgi:hypothetical protein